MRVKSFVPPVLLLLMAAACGPSPSPSPSPSTPSSSSSPSSPSAPAPGPKAACADGTDNDGDGKVDYPADPGCFSATDTDEANPAIGPGNAHRMIVWASYEKLSNFSDAQLDQCK